MKKFQIKIVIYYFLFCMSLLLITSTILAQTSLELGLTESVETPVSKEVVKESVITDSAGLLQEKKLLSCISKKQLIDGLYIGESLEWTGMKVQVEVSQGEIQKVNVLDVHGSADYYDVVVKMLPRRMKRNKTYQVDGITGSTLSCESIKSAVKLALYQAMPNAASN